jgi:hypothetical protein
METDAEIDNLRREKITSNEDNPHTTIRIPRKKRQSTTPQKSSNLETATSRHDKPLPQDNIPDQKEPVQENQYTVHSEAKKSDPTERFYQCTDHGVNATKINTGS